MDWTPIVSAAVGGSIGIISSIVVTALTHRREDRIRWDDDRLRAIGDVVSTGSQLIGWHYRRGKAIAVGAPTEVLEARERTCNDGLNQLHAEIFRASLLTPALAPLFDNLLAAEKALRITADDGLTREDGDYATSKGAIMNAIKSIQIASASVLTTHSVKRPSGRLRNIESEMLA